MWSAGQQVGGYEIVAKLREGGMATLFLARESQGAAGKLRHVALKIIHPRLAHDEQFRHMFLDEAMLASRIVHPNVVRVEELGEHRGAQFLAMEFVHGCSLAQLQRALLARRRRLAPAFAARIAMQVAEGLHAAHELRDDAGRLLNVVHRDVTPENILLAYSGEVKLIDFGIAKSYGRRHRTQDGLLKGKFRYMAPEQALGRAVDRRVDIYQLGIVLWEMLTLRRLFSAEREIDLLASVQRPDIDPPSTWADRIPESLDLAVMAALHPDPSRRTPDGLTFSHALRSAVPAAEKVDAAALRALLESAMREHREQERAQYPRGVYDRLDKQAQARVGGRARGAQQATKLIAPGDAPQRLSDAAPRSDHDEYTEQFGSDSPERPTRPGSAARGAARKSQRALRGRRPLKLVRFATELHTSLTAMVDSRFVGSRTYWILIGAAVGLFAASVLIVLALEPRNRAVPALPLSHDAPSPPPIPTRAR